MKVLICDDDASDLTMVRYILRKAYKDADVSEAHTCEDAKSMVAKMDVVIMDQKLVGTQGVECLKQIRKDGYRGVFILLTGYTDDNTALEAIREGADNFLLKSVMFENLTPAIDKAIESRRELIQKTVEAQENVKVLDDLGTQVDKLEKKLETKIEHKE